MAERTISVSLAGTPPGRGRAFCELWLECAGKSMITRYKATLSRPRRARRGSAAATESLASAIRTARSRWAGQPRRGRGRCARAGPRCYIGWARDLHQRRQRRSFGHSGTSPPRRRGAQGVAIPEEAPLAGGGLRCRHEHSRGDTARALVPSCHFGDSQGLWRY